MSDIDANENEVGDQTLPREQEGEPVEEPASVEAPDEETEEQQEEVQDEEIRDDENEEVEVMEEKTEEVEEEAAEDEGPAVEEEEQEEAEEAPLNDNEEENEAAEEEEAEEEADASAEVENEPKDNEGADIAEDEACDESNDDYSSVLAKYDIPEDDHRDFYQSFRLVENDRGYIEGSDAYRLLQSLGQDPDNEVAVEQMLSDNGLDSSSQLSFEDFVSISSKYYKSKSQLNDDLMRSFQVFDKNGNGYLEYDELYKAIFKIGDRALEEEAKEEFDELVRLIDVNQDGRIDYSEFCRMVTLGVNGLKEALYDS